WFGKHPKEERASQQMAVHENNIAPWAGGTDYFIVDIEYDNHQGARFDLVALQWESKASARKLQGYKPRLTAIEMKSGDGALKGDAGLLEHFQQWDKFFSDRVQLNNFKDEMLKLFAQKRALGLIPALAGNHNPVTELDLAVEVIFLIANHDPASRKLRDEVRKVQAQVKSTPPEFNILCATATFMGYGLYLQNILTLDEFAKS
ncbi:MAG: hypothetical protein NTY53_05420, partial [Kiritimatiellaeota bacterium]|nr:hypothetical protein [Kiritimatiellota bacterium]